jgi:hypothetical protein
MLSSLRKYHFSFGEYLDEFIQELPDQVLNAGCGRFTEDDDGAPAWRQEQT